jgi:hypothetical protein
MLYALKWDQQEREEGRGREGGREGGEREIRYMM